MPDRDPIDVAMERIVSFADTHALDPALFTKEQRDAAIRAALTTLVAAVGKTPAEERVLAAVLERDRAAGFLATCEDSDDFMASVDLDAATEAESDAVSALRAEREGGLPMTARPETLEVRHETWDEAIVQTWCDATDSWEAWVAHTPVDVDDDVGRYCGVVAIGRRDLRTPYYPTPQAAADALAVLIDGTPELRHLRPGGAL